MIAAVAHAGAMRPKPITPGPGQESVWDYPRPPAVDPSTKHVRVRARAGGPVVADTHQAVRVLETSHPPTWYVPPAAVVDGAVRRSAARSTTCEFKGAATYWDLVTDDGVVEAAAWSYEDPTPGFASLKGYLAFSPGKVACSVADEVVRPQEGGFYGGWVTDDVVGPFKGAPGTWGW